MARRRQFLFFLLAAVVVGLAATWLFWPRTAISDETAAKIKVGMTVAEVEEILGGPQGDYTTLLGGLGEYRAPPNPPFEDVDDQEWIGDSGAVWVYFDRHGRVCACHFVEATHAPLTLGERLGIWYRMLCRRLAAR
jgi:hypothetical protein